LDLFGPTRVKSTGGKMYGLLIIDDYNRWTSVRFLKHKDKIFRVFCKFMKHVQNEKGLSIIIVRSDHVGIFGNKSFQDGVFQRKHRVLQDIVKTMLNSNSTPKRFWVEAINTICHLQNKIYIGPFLKKTPYNNLWTLVWMPLYRFPSQTS